MSLPPDDYLHLGRPAALGLLLAVGCAHAALATPQCLGAEPQGLAGNDPTATMTIIVGPGNQAQAQTSQPGRVPRTLSETDSKRVVELDKAIIALWRKGKFAEAIEPAFQALSICNQAFGHDHWVTANWRREVGTLRATAALPATGKLALSGVVDLNAAGKAAYDKGQFAEATDSFRQALELRRRWLGERHPSTATSYNDLAVVLRSCGDLPDAEAMHRKALAIRLEALGEGHPETAASYNNLGTVLLERGDLPGAEAMLRKALAIKIGVLGERHLDTAMSYHSLAAVLDERGDLPGAEAIHCRALAIKIEVLGERHHEVAFSYTALGFALHERGELDGAEALHRKALAIRLETRGERHPETAHSFDGLAHVLRARGDLPGAEAMHRKALAIRVEAHGDRNPLTAESYEGLASVLVDRCDLAGAEALYRKALGIRLETHGERSTRTAVTFHNVARVLFARGELAGAEAMQRRALDIATAALGERHALTGVMLNNLGAMLADSGDLAGAEAMHRKALGIRLESPGELHLDTATSYHNLAQVLSERGDLAGAEEMDRKALAIRLERLGEHHPDVALSFNNLGTVLSKRGDLAGAVALHRKALMIQIERLGEHHRDTVTSYSWMGLGLASVGRSAEAIAALESAARATDEVRRQSRGLEDVGARRSDPFPFLALLLARACRPRDAWERWERGLSRALLDEIAGRAARLLTEDERQREATLLAQAQAGDERLNRLLARGKPTPEIEKQLETLRSEGNEIRRRLLVLQGQLEQKYGPLAGQPATLKAARAALDDTSALVGWVDGDQFHYACVLRRSGDPIWVEVSGSGKDGAWTKDEETMARRLYAALASRSGDDSHSLAGALARQRVAPLDPHLKGVKRVIVVNSPKLAGLPIEVLFAERAQAGSPAPIVSYAPSASMFAYLAGKKPAQSRPEILLAVGDPAYPESKSKPALPPPPSSGLLVVGVDPKGNAGSRGVRSGDVLLAYDGVPLKTPANVRLAPAEGPPRKVPIRVWRNGQEQTVEVAAGRLGIAVDPRPSAEGVLAQRAADEVRRGSRADTLPRLPGTRREVKAIVGLFPDGCSTTLLGDEARESVVQQMARAGELKGFRYLHFATHGRTDPPSAYRTALILAPDPDRSADPLAVDTDGEINALEIARTWNLDADLVVLSACETALGRHAGGEGILGFAQPLLAKGARSLVLSLWRVDDKATSLLMARFYQNLLGKRRGVSKRMRKAEALHEAKTWLRNLTEGEVGDELTALDRGEVRPLTKLSGTAESKAAPSSRPAGVRPYAHPSFWAAFVLVGDPD
jgi:tetratricopeptide (TPR) repeat protein